MKIASARAVRPPMARRHPARNLFIHVPPPCRADAPLLAGAGRRYSTGLISGGITTTIGVPLPSEVQTSRTAFTGRGWIVT